MPEYLHERRRLTLPADSNARKMIPRHSGCDAYFPAALAGVAFHSMKSNEKHNPGQPLHWSRGKSNDHADCISRHKSDIADLLARIDRGEEFDPRELLDEADALAWRALALSQELHENFGGAPLAPAARLPVMEVSTVIRTPEEIAAYIQRLNNDGPLESCDE